MNFVLCLSSCLSCSIFNVWIAWKDLAQLDCALCEKKSRPAFLCLLSSVECVVETPMSQSDSSFLRWLLSRQIKVQHFPITTHTDEELGAQYVNKYGSLISMIVRTQSITVPQLGVEIIQTVSLFGNLTSVLCHHLTVSLLNLILSHSPRLQTLGFAVIPRSTDDSVLIEKVMSNIIDLRVSESRVVVVDVISMCPNIRKLKVDGLLYPTSRDSNDLVDIAEKCRHLRTLSVPNTRYVNRAYQQMSTSPHLRVITVRPSHRAAMLAILATIRNKITITTCKTDRDVNILEYPVE